MKFLVIGGTGLIGSKTVARLQALGHEVIVGSSASGIVEIAGPERVPLADLVARFLKVTQDPREVVGDPQARYFGAELESGTLIPRDGAWLGANGFVQWLRTSSFARYAPAA